MVLIQKGYAAISLTSSIHPSSWHAQVTEVDGVDFVTPDKQDWRFARLCKNNFAMYDKLVELRNAATDQLMARANSAAHGEAIHELQPEH
eukprot:4497716-Pyramimonas_sp.AAC.1